MIRQLRLRLLPRARLLFFSLVMGWAPAIGAEARLWLGLQLVDEHSGHELEAPVGEFGLEVDIMRADPFALTWIVIEHDSNLGRRDTGGGINSTGLRIYLEF